MEPDISERKNIEELTRIGCCYIIALPTDVKGQVIFDELKKRNIDSEVAYDIVEANDWYGLNYKYIKLIYNSPEPVNKILEESVFKVNDQNLLIVPEIKNVNLFITSTIIRFP